MQELMKNGITMTSRELAELTGKNHADVMRDIRDEVEKLKKEGEVGLSIFAESKYINSQNKEQPMYSFGREGAMQIAMRYSAIIRRKVILKLEEMEKAWNTPALVMARALQIANKELEEHRARVLEYKPKAEFYDDIMQSDDTIDIGQLAKTLNINGIGRNKLFEILREKKILDRRNIPYQNFVDAGYFRTIETSYTSGGDTKIHIKTVVFQKGVDYIRKILKK